MARPNGGILVPPAHGADEPANTESRECRGVGTLLDDATDEVLGIDGAAAHNVGSLRRAVFRLAIEILRCSGRLVHEPLGLGSRVTSDPAKTFLRLAADVSGGTRNSVL